MAAQVIDFNKIFTPRPWQKTCIDEQTRFSVISLHRRAGKTTLALALCILYGLQTPGTYGYICPQLNQAERNAWMPLKNMVSQLGASRVGDKVQSNAMILESKKAIRFINGSEILLLGADDPDNLRGIKFAGCVLDEVAQMPPEAWTEVVMPALADTNGWALFIGTFKGQDLFAQLLRQGRNPKFQPEWSTHSYNVYQTGIFSDEQIEQFKRDSDEITFRREWLCDESVEGFNQLVSWETADAATNRVMKQEDFSSYRKILGVDVARYGNDSSVLQLRQGFYAKEPEVYKGLSLVELAEKVANRIRMDGVDVTYVDGTGVGGGVVDILRSWGLEVYDINFAMKASTSTYANKRSEMWCRMGEWLKKARIPDNRKLWMDLTAPQYEKDEGGRISIESKKAIKKRLGSSPDLADALALTFCGYEADQPMPRGFDGLYSKQRALTPNERYKQQIKNSSVQRNCYSPYAALRSSLGGSRGRAF